MQEAGARSNLQYGDLGWGLLVRVESLTVTTALVLSEDGRKRLRMFFKLSLGSTISEGIALGVWD